MPNSFFPSCFPAFLLVLAFLSPLPARAAEIAAGPSDYREKVRSLQPGDVLSLEPGTYSSLLSIDGLNGTPDAWITIRGPAGENSSAVFTADPGPCCNTIEIRNSSYVAIENLVVYGGGVAGAFGVSAKDGLSNHVHHIRIENCTFLRHDADQQTVAISTKTPTWGWVIRGNRILGAGTGMYLGNSDGSSPFFGGVIEYNLIVDTLGYNIQIKWQQPRPAIDGMPLEPVSNVIRHNVFIKRDRESPSGDRPNLLVGGFPSSGPGSEDWSEIYGNFFFHNPRESLLQASGRVSIHDNVFVDTAQTAIALQDHDLPLRAARVYNNTIYAAATGVRVSGTLDQGAHVTGNLVFAGTGLSGTPTSQAENLFLSVDDAARYVKNPSTELGNMDFYPLPGACTGTSLDLSAFSGDLDWNRDFNGTPKGDFTFRGAYAGSGDNPGWALDEDIKGTAAQDAGIPDADHDGEVPDAAGDGGDAAPNHPESSGSGCSCRQAGSPRTAEVLPLWLLILALLLCRRFESGRCRR